MEDIPMDVYEAEALAMFGSNAGAEPPKTELPVPTEAPAQAETPASQTEVPPTPNEPPAPTPAPAIPAPEPAEDTPRATEPYRMVGEVFRSYVIVEQGDRILLIDKHAAHERVIFEGLKANMRKKQVDSQLLMIPVEVMLMSEEVGLLDTYRAEIEAAGFSYSCQRFTVRVDAIPSGIAIEAVPDMMAAIAEQLKGGVDTATLARDILFEKALYQASCKAAIKAGRDYPAEHIKWLVDKLMELPDITFCPHGRPVAMEMKKRNIDHQFERC
jgi:DNA mismatch repair protein MutL